MGIKNHTKSAVLDSKRQQGETIMNREYHVAVTGCDFWEGTKKQPFRTISKAAEIAMPGDTVTVHEGEYREWVKPANGGSSEIQRIVYQAAAGEKVVIKGSERIQNWEQYEGTVWKSVLSNEMFGDYNPYKEILDGDWFEFPKNKLHTGEVYLNGKSFYETCSLEEVKHPVIRTEGYCRLWPNYTEPILHPEDTRYQWYVETDDTNTTIYANFQGADPNQELVEINVRRSCFYPEKIGRNYITVHGFEMAQAACPWVPPTADQPGLLGVNWAKGWVIENNVIHDAKCSGISIGKEESTGHNLCTRTSQKPGYQYQMESVFRARQIGWSKETIGSHVIRNNVIYDCGQNGIVGHMGCVFSQIYDNHIYNIAVKHEFFGYEIAGIKLHAAVDVQIIHNHIHNCSLGTWLDWQAQGTRVSRNLYYQNDRDWMIEVTHGPCLVDNNIFGSDFSIENYAQGTAYVNNLQCGVMHREAVLNRATPYHFPHTTEIAGTAVVYSADDRFYQNIFLGDSQMPCGGLVTTGTVFYGTADYDGCPETLEEYIGETKAKNLGDLEDHLNTRQPAYINRNVYLKDAPAYASEKEQYLSKHDPHVQILTKEDGVYLEIDVEKELLDIKTEIVDTKKLGMVRIVEAPFDDPQGNPIVLDRDYHGNLRGEHSSAGPFEGLKAGHNCIKIWE